MSSQITPRLWELLSAYLDEQLDSKEKANLDQMLAGDQSLRDALNRLRTGRELLQRLPEHPVPHHFTLTRQMAATSRLSFTNRWLGYSSLAAMLMLVVTFAAQLFTYAPRLSLSAQAPLMELEAPEDMGEPSPQIIIWGIPFGKGGGGGGGFGGGENTPREVAPLLLVPTAGGATPQATPEPRRLEEPVQPPANLLRTLAPQGPILGIRPTQEMGIFILSPTAVPPATSDSRAEPFVLSTYFLILQGGVLAAALIFGTLWLVKRSRR